jgi:ADP-ribose pyrophosphatase
VPAKRTPLRYRVVFSAQPWFDIEASVPTEPDEQPYYRMNTSDGIICLPLTSAGDVVMIRQFRPVLGHETIEVPGGAIDGDESPHDAVRREVMEETGHRCGPLLTLTVGGLYLNRCTQHEHMVLALDCEAVPGATTDAGIVTQIVPRPELIEMIRRDEIEQTAMLSFMGLASAKLGVDLLRDPIETIRRRALEA